MDWRQKLIVRILFVIAYIIAIGGEESLSNEVKNLANAVNSFRIPE